MTFPFMPIAVACKAVVSCFDLYMTYRQRSNFHPSLPPSPRIRSLIPPSKFRQAQAYCRAKSTFQLISGSIEIVLETILTLCFFTPWIWNVASKYEIVTSELRHTLMFLTILSVFSSITELPFEIYSTFVLEAKFGFNKTTVKTFVTDHIKNLLLSALFGYPLISLFYFVLKYVERFTPFVIASSLWLFSCFLMVLMMWLFPNVIAPMFNSFTPMKSGSSIKKKVESLAVQFNFPLSKIYVIDGSKRSAHSNAFIFGLFKKYICIYDTLLNQYKDKKEKDDSSSSTITTTATATKEEERSEITDIPDDEKKQDEDIDDDEEQNDEVVAVICHELGHWKYGHLSKGVVKSLIHTFVISLIYALTVGNDDLFKSFGFHLVEKPVILSMILFNNMLSPIDDLMHPLHNYVSRKFEYEADEFAKKNNMHLQLGNALVRMSIENLSNMNPDHLYSTWNYSHPTLIERLDALGVSPKINLSKNKDADQDDNKKEN